MAETADSLRDVVVVGGGAAGLSAALTLTRARRAVTVVDAGKPRNAPARAVHGLLGLEGMSPLELLKRGREEVQRYGGQIVAAHVRDVSATPEGFAVTLDDGGVVCGRVLLIATGLADQLPEIPGLEERWGQDVIHCPYCHGWEVRDRVIGVLATGPMSVHQTLMFRQWSAEVRFFPRDLEFGAEELEKLAAVGIPVIRGDVTGLGVEADRLVSVRMADGRVVELEALAVSSRMVARAEAFAGIGIVPTEHAMGSHIAADPTGRTSVPGVWVAGNATDPAAQVSGAAADGARVAMRINTDLIFEDTDRAVARRRALTPAEVAR
ncbi:NAD(P)/FAD-dependent oxidoreductase [Arthrobacter sp. NPDC058130]|uniref:NAD(P)/FAD-dependent oxidoreductase n=1 Tax=Arthrobacter sp. NPDC058130 TaxID=3346353 RepID=UPI0036E10E35